MFQNLSPFETIIVTGPHRSGTTIAAEMIAHDLGRRCWREEAFSIRNIVEAEALIRDHGGVIQGPYLLPWAPVLADIGKTAIVYMQRHPDAVARSNARLQRRRISAPFFNKDQADRLWHRIKPAIDNWFEVDYTELEAHPLYQHHREGWRHRQTRPGQARGL